MPIVSSMAPVVVIMKTYRAVSDYKVGIMTMSMFQFTIEECCAKNGVKGMDK